MVTNIIFSKRNIFRSDGYLILSYDFISGNVGINKNILIMHQVFVNVLR